MSLLSTLRVAVIGAGLSGSSVANSLHKLGCSKLVVFDRVPSMRALESSSTASLISANGVRVLDALNLSAPLYKQAHPIYKHTQRNVRGDMLAAFSPSTVIHDRLQHGDRLTNVAVAHSRLIDLLHSSLPSHAVRFNHEVKSVEQSDTGYQVKFAGGEDPYDADLIIAADGIHSSIRQNYVQQGRGSGVRTLDGLYVHGLSSGGTVDYEPDELLEMWGNGQRFGSASIGGGHHWWFATIHSSFANSVKDPKSLSQTFDKFPLWVRDQISRTDRERYQHTQLVDLPPQSPIYRDGVVLVGSSACSLTIDYFQHSAQCLEGALILALCLHEQESIQRALDAYQRRRVPRLNFLSNASHSEAETAVKKSKFLSSLRDMASSMMPKQVVNSVFESAIGYNIFREFPELSTIRDEHRH